MTLFLTILIRRFILLTGKGHTGICRNSLYCLKIWGLRAKAIHNEIGVRCELVWKILIPPISLLHRNSNPIMPRLYRPETGFSP